MQSYTPISPLKKALLGRARLLPSLFFPGRRLGRSLALPFFNRLLSARLTRCQWLEGAEAGMKGPAEESSGCPRAKLDLRDASLPLGTRQSVCCLHGEYVRKALSESGSASTHLTITDESMTYFVGAGREARGWRERRCLRRHASRTPLPGSADCAPEPDERPRDQPAFRSETNAGPPLHRPARSGPDSC